MLIILTPTQNIKEGIEGHPVEWYSEVFNLIFPDINKESANKLWEKELKREIFLANVQLYRALGGG